MTLPLRPQHGGFLRSFGCGEFVRDLLLGKGPHGAPRIDPAVGAPQADICHYYKNALLRATAEDRAAASEERRAKRVQQRIDPERIATLTEKYLARMPFKTSSCRYHSFVVYFSTLKRLGWVEPSGRKEPSALQANYPKGHARIFYRLTPAGRKAPASAWANPYRTLYHKP